MSSQVESIKTPQKENVQEIHQGAALELTSEHTSDICPDICIEGVTHETVTRYFETLNAGQFEATAALFAEDGALLPPFEEPVVGQEAIATYLHREATGMQLQPRAGEREALETGDTQFRIKGKVQTPFFGVNVGWIFVLTPQSKLRSAQIRLLASPRELLKLRR